MAACIFTDAAMNVPGSSLLIDVDRLSVLLGDRRDRFSIQAIDACDSTNTLLLQRVHEMPSGRVVVCDRQTAGRGSRGRRWSASPEASLTFSLLWHFDCGLAGMSGLSLCVGLAAVRALTACGAHGATLKWPNDILHRDAKLGGILVELSGDAEQARAVIGIGLNLLTPKMDGHGEVFMMPVTAIDALVSPLPERNQLLAGLLTELADIFDRFAVHGFGALRDEWQACHAWQGRVVHVLSNGRVDMAGICLGADADGALLVQVGGDVRRCLSGDVSLRVAS